MAEQTTALETRQDESFVQEMTPKDSSRIAELAVVAKALALSGYFKDFDPVNLRRGASQALVKILRGQDLGISPTSAAENIYIIENKTTCSAHLMAGLIRRSGATFIVRSNTESECVLDFFDEKGEVIGRSEFTLDDAELAGVLNKNNWKRYPKDMYYARAMSRGFNRFFSHLALGGLHTPEELGYDSKEAIFSASTSSNAQESLNDKLLESSQEREQEIEELKAQLKEERDASQDLAREAKKESKEQEAERASKRAEIMSKLTSSSEEEKAPIEKKSIEQLQKEAREKVFGSKDDDEQSEEETSEEASSIEDNPHINHDSEFAREVADLPDEWPTIKSSDMRFDVFELYAVEMFGDTTNEVLNRLIADRLELTEVQIPRLNIKKLSATNLTKVYQTMSRARQRNKHDSEKAFEFIVWCQSHGYSLVSTRQLDAHVVEYKKHLKALKKGGNS